MHTQQETFFSSLIKNTLMYSEIFSQLQLQPRGIYLKEIRFSVLKKSYAAHMLLRVHSTEMMPVWPPPLYKQGRCQHWEYFPLINVCNVPSFEDDDVFWWKHHAHTRAENLALGLTFSPWFCRFCEILSIFWISFANMLLNTQRFTSSISGTSKLL